MKIINIGILAHVDAGKTTLTESLLYTSGAIAEQGNVDKGTTRTDTMILERQRGITIQTAVTSFYWNDYKINIVDTPGHMDFLTEAYRSLSVLDGAVLVISAKDGVQAQTRILFHALQKMDIPTIIFINKIDQNGIDLQCVYQSIKDKLTSDMIVMQEVSLSPKITMTDISDLDKWDMIISGSDELLERYVAEDSLDIQELQYEKCKRTRCCSLFPVYHGSAKDNLGTEKLIEAIIETFITETDDIQSELCGYVFKVEYTERKKRLSYLRLYHGTLHLRDTLLLSKKEKIKITEMCIPSNGEIVPADHACPGGGHLQRAEHRIVEGICPLERHQPVFMVAGRPQGAAVGQIVIFEDQAVHGEGILLRTIERNGLLQGIQGRIGCQDRIAHGRKAHLGQKTQIFPLGRAAQILTDQVERQKLQPTFLALLGVQLSDAASGQIPGMGIGLGQRLIERIEILPADHPLAAHLQRFGTRDGQRHVPHDPDSMGDILALEAVAAGNGLGQFPVLIAQYQGKPVQFPADDHLPPADELEDLSRGLGLIG